MSSTRTAQSLSALAGCLSACRFIGLTFMMGLTGCESTMPVTRSYIDVKAPVSAAEVFEARLDPCVDRTGTKSRDLSADATTAFRRKLPATKIVALKDDARFRIACEVTSYAEGSAFQRWLLPGSGSTIGQVAAMVTDAATGEIVVIVRGNATVSAGGLYSAGADDYIIAAAVQDVVNQLQGWIRGRDVQRDPVQGK